MQNIDTIRSEIFGRRHGDTRGGGIFDERRGFGLTQFMRGLIRKQGARWRLIDCGLHWLAFYMVINARNNWLYLYALTESFDRTRKCIFTVICVICMPKRLQFTRRKIKWLLTIRRKRFQSLSPLPLSLCNLVRKKFQRSKCDVCGALK